MKDFLSGFKGQPLDKRQIAAGMHLCYTNARTLADEAKLLKENGYYARALSLTILGLEELGKIPLILDMILCPADDAEAWRRAWQELQSHKVKLGVMTVYGRQVLRVLGKSFETELPLGIEPLANKFKQLGFYVTFFKDRFILPEEFAKENYEWLDWLLLVLRERISSFERLHGSLQNSERFTDEAVEFVATVRQAKTRSERKKMVSDWLSQHMGLLHQKNE